MSTTIRKHLQQHEHADVIGRGTAPAMAPRDPRPPPQPAAAATTTATRTTKKQQHKPRWRQGNELLRSRGVNTGIESASLCKRNCSLDRTAVYTTFCVVQIKSYAAPLCPAPMRNCSNKAISDFFILPLFLQLSSLYFIFCLKIR